MNKKNIEIQINDLLVELVKDGGIHAVMHDFGDDGVPNDGAVRENFEQIVWDMALQQPRVGAAWEEDVLPVGWPMVSVSGEELVTDPDEEDNDAHAKEIQNHFEKNVATFTKNVLKHPAQASEIAGLDIDDLADRIQLREQDERE